MLSLALVTLLAPVQDLPLGADWSAPPIAETPVSGRWEGRIPVPGQIEYEPYALVLEEHDGRVRGNLEVDGRSLPVRGRRDEAGALVLQGSLGAGLFSSTLALADGHLEGTVEAWGGAVPVRATRVAEASAGPEPVVVDFELEHPRRVALSVLSATDAAALEAAVLAFVRDARIVGLSCALVREREIVDVRSYGWEDFTRRVPASERTLYRWASISKPLTAVAALQLADAGKLDLDRDVRAYVPEFPDHGHVVTAHQLLAHLGSVTHYSAMRLRTVREYDVPHPFADPVLAIDMFKETPLLFEPGTRYHYSTPGYVLLGAVITRAGGADYAEQVRRRILDPLGMTSMLPDRPWEDLPHETRGYANAGEGLVVETKEDEITWKLAAGGWHSTIEDLARFGIGLAGDGLLAPETRAAMYTVQRTSAGEETEYGLGIGVGELGGVKTVAHSGGQRKTSTYLIVAPEQGCAVALMCNTQGRSLSGLARELLPLLLP